MNKPVLVVMAAGMGSRYGGLKQIDPVGGHGQLIIDYSIFDARRAGFETVVFIIKHEIEADFKAAIGDRLSKVMDVRYAIQQLDDLPAGLRRARRPRQALGHQPRHPVGPGRHRRPVRRDQRRRLLRPRGVPEDLRLPAWPTRTGTANMNTPWSAICWRTR